jgi:hypothetical protein
MSVGFAAMSLRMHQHAVCMQGKHVRGCYLLRIRSDEPPSLRSCHLHFRIVWVALAEAPLPGCLMPGLAVSIVCPLRTPLWSSLSFCTASASHALARALPPRQLWLWHWHLWYRVSLGLLGVVRAEKRGGP